MGEVEDVRLGLLQNLELCVSPFNRKNAGAKVFAAQNLVDAF